jgi:hypothetical protein
MLADSGAAASRPTPSKCSLLAGCSRPALATSLLLILTVQPAARSCYGADVTLEEIRAGYIQTVTSMPSIWTRCTLKRTIPEERARLMAEALSRSAESFGVDEAVVEWATDGLKSHYHAHSGVKPDGSTFRPDWFSCDGSRVWWLEYSDAEKDYAPWYAMHKSLETGTDSDVRINHTPGKWLGLYFSISEQQQSGASLAKLLHSGQPRLIGPEEVDGHLCYRVEMLFPSARQEDTLPVTAWFDPAVGYLPRWLSNDFNRDAPPSDYRVLSFRQVSVGNSKEPLWFPDRMMIERRNINDSIMATDELTLVEVRINEPLAGDLFRPKLPAGVPAFDLDKPSEEQRLRSFRTKEIREQKMAEYQAAKANRVPTPAPAAVVPAIAAQPPSGLSWPLILIGTGVLMLVVGSVWRFRRARTAMLAVFVMQPAVPTCFGADVTLEEIRAGYVQTVTSMRTIWTRCAWKRTLPEAKADALARMDFSAFDGAVIEWAVDDLKSHYHAYGGARPDGQLRRPDWFSCDAKRVWTLEYSKEEGYAPVYAAYQSLATGTDSALRMKHTPAKWLGLYFSISEQQQSGASLITLLRSGEPRLVGSEEIDGHLCYRVEMTYKTALPGEALPVTAWFDPEVGYLPRIITTDFNPGGVPADYRVHSFRKVRLGQDGQTAWFPEHMSIERSISTNELTLLESRINEPLARDLFRPKLPSELPVFNLDNKAEVQRLLRFHSQPARDEKMAEARAAKADRVPTPSAAAVVPAIAAEAPTQLSWPVVLMIAGFLMLVVGTFWVYRRPGSV